MMTQTVLAGTMATLLMMAGGVAQAQGAGFGRGPKPVPFEELDANGDGEVTRAEMQANGQARFEKADTDGDGYLSVAELEAGAQAKARRFIGLLMSRADANDDGKLSIEEMRDAAPNRAAVFDEMDTDGSGGLTRAEMEAGQKSFRQKHSTPPAEQG